MANLKNKNLISISDYNKEEYLEILRIAEKFEKNPPNQHARFFDFDIDQQGLKVTVL